MKIKNEIKQRTYDGKFVVWGLIQDPCFVATKPEDQNAVWVSQRWVMFGVHESLDNAKKQTSRLDS